MKFIAFFFLCLTSLEIQGQMVFSPPVNKPEVKPLLIHENINVDGYLNEKIWSKMEPIYLDFQVEPFQGNKSNFKTEVKLAYNQHFLYVSAINYDTIGKHNFRAPNLKRDYLYSENDLFGIALDGFNDQRNSICLQTNAYGAQRDLLSFDDRQFDIDWDGLFRVRTHRSDTAWVAEFSIPWQSLRYPSVNPLNGQNWGVNFFRNRRSSNELTVWSPHPRATSPLRMDYAGKLIGIIPPPPSKTNIRFVPYLLHVSSQESGTLVGNSSRNQFVMGGEIKWVITPTSILDFTFNTDFAQADVDKQVNNVSRFSVFFPERRQFFLENASLFSSGLTQVSGVLGGSMAIQPFFSRTIGLSKQVQPIPIVAGTRYVYRSEKRNFGGIFMRQGEGDGDPYTHFSVARYSENFGKQNRFGTIWTNKQSPSNSQTTGAIDGFIRFDDVLSLSTMATFSHDVSLAQTGFSEFSQIFYRSNNINAYWTQTVVSSQYNPSMGFVSRNNIASNSQGFAYNIRKKWFPSWIRGIEPGVYSEIYHNLTTGVAVEKKLLFSPFWIYLQNGGYIGTYLDGSIQNLDDNFSPLGIRILKGNYEYLRKGIMLSSDPSAKYFGSINYEWGNFYDGNLNFVQFKTRFAPIPNINFALTFERNFVDRLGAKQESKNVDLAIFETRLAINPRIQLIGFYQKNSSNDRNAINMRIAWEYQPLSYVYLVFNQTNYLGSDLNNQIEKQFLTKLSYLKQF